MEHFEKKNGFVQRQLTDNAYIARIARKYLETLYCDGKNHVWSVNGAMTTVELKAFFATIKKKRFIS